MDYKKDIHTEQTINETNRQTLWNIFIDIKVYDIS